MPRSPTPTLGNYLGAPLGHSFPLVLVVRTRVGPQVQQAAQRTLQAMDAKNDPEAAKEQLETLLSELQGMQQNK